VRTVVELAEMAGVTWFDHQVEAFEGWCLQQAEKACLYFKTGSGKSITSLTMMALKDRDTALVVTPPSTHPEWHAAAAKLGMTVDTISHAKFRQKDYRISRNQAVIVDEFHMLGGHGGKGWKKLDTLARGLQAPLIICSATPNYNDAERVYCIQHVLEPHKVKGGYLEFLYAHCNTAQNPFGMEPLVDEDQPFRNFKDAAEYLSSLDNVYYLPDDLVYQIVDHDVFIPLPAELETYGYEPRAHRMIASGMEERHTKVQLRLIDEEGLIQDEVYTLLTALCEKTLGPVLIFSNHETVARALADTLNVAGEDFGLVTGKVSTKAKADEIRRFKAGEYDVLIGTASLATGTDGLDKMCDHLIILDDTDDDALRRQLIGRIMPRGADTDTSKKQVHRVVLTDL